MARDEREPEEQEQEECEEEGREKSRKEQTVTEEEQEEDKEQEKTEREDGSWGRQKHAEFEYSRAENEFVVSMYNLFATSELAV